MPAPVQQWRLVLAVVLGACVPCGWAKDSAMTDDEVAVRTQGGHHLLLPKDWPVEQRDGRIVPIPIEEYLSMKFGQVATTFEERDRRLETLEQRLQKLEESQKVLQQRLRLLEQAAPEGR